MKSEDATAGLNSESTESTIEHSSRVHAEHVWMACVHGGPSVPIEVILQRLQSRLDAKRTALSEALKTLR